MKQQITTYFREYYNNFKQKPLQGSAVLAMQILFLLGWGMFYTYLYRLYTSFIIPGISQPKGNIYVETINCILQLLIFTYIFIKIWPLMFGNEKKLRWRFTALLISFLMAVIFINDIFNVQIFMPHTPVIREAFWCWSCGN